MGLRFQRSICQVQTTLDRALPTCTGWCQLASATPAEDLSRRIWYTVSERYELCVRI
jgi:hypothetical protein